MTAASKYRGAVVEDLQLPPAFALPCQESISRVIELAYERDFSHIPCVLSPSPSPPSHLPSLLSLPSLFPFPSKKHT
ncbi:hypothetical protein BDN71DRAFT_1456877, partial [Pleurotus eryngii]